METAAREAPDAEQKVAIRRQMIALNQEPLVVDVPEVAMNVTRAAGTTADRTTWSADLLDEDALIAALLVNARECSNAIPFDLLCIDTVKLNQYARDLKEHINTWPGVKAKKTTKVV